jgi:hypothetical protein
MCVWMWFCMLMWFFIHLCIVFVQIFGAGASPFVYIHVFSKKKCFQYCLKYIYIYIYICFARQIFIVNNKHMHRHMHIHTHVLTHTYAHKNMCVYKLYGHVCPFTPHWKLKVHLCALLYKHYGAVDFCAHKVEYRIYWQLLHTYHFLAYSITCIIVVSTGR